MIQWVKNLEYIKNIFNMILYIIFPGGVVVKNPPAKQKMQVQSLGQKDPLEKETATLSSILGNAMDREVWRATVHGVAKESDRT